jgi:hypothetical protein
MINIKEELEDNIMSAGKVGKDDNGEKEEEAKPAKNKKNADLITVHVSPFFSDIFCVSV